MLLAVPAIRALRAGRPAARLVLAAQERIGALLTLLGAVDDHVSFDSLGLHALFADEIGRPEPRRDRDNQSGRSTEPGRFSLRPTEPGRFFLRPPTGQAGLADLATMVSWFGARDPSFVARVRALAPSAMIAPSVPAGGLVWEHLLATVGGDSAAADRTPLSVPAALITDGARALRAAGWDGETHLLMIHPGAGGTIKRWPAEGFARFVAAVGGRHALAVHQGPADAEAVAAFVLLHRGPVIRLVEPTLPLLAGALTHVAAFVGNDSGVSHLASALGGHALVLFMAENLAWRPWVGAARPLVVDTSELRADDLDRVITVGGQILG